MSSSMAESMPHSGRIAGATAGRWQIPWNAKPDAGRLAPGVPPSNFWASDPNGINQVGCVYTAQGFEFDYVGVIWGRDLTWDPATDAWRGDPSHFHDSIVKRSGDRFTDLVKRTYRVLLTRGLKGCYVYVDDSTSKEYFSSHQSRLATGGKVDDQPSSVQA